MNIELTKAVQHQLMTGWYTEDQLETFLELLKEENNMAEFNIPMPKYNKPTDCTVEFTDCPTSTSVIMPLAASWPEANKKNKKEQTMHEINIENHFDMPMQSSGVSEDARKTEFLKGELWEVRLQHRNKLLDHFHLDGLKPPQSPKEMIEYIQKGWYKFKKKVTKDGSWHDPDNHPWFSSEHLPYYLTWENEETKPDQAGFDAAHEKMVTAHKDALRQIVTGTPAEGLAALKAFEAASFH